MDEEQGHWAFSGDVATFFLRGKPRGGVSYSYAAEAYSIRCDKCVRSTFMDRYAEKTEAQSAFLQHMLDDDLNEVNKVLLRSM